MLLVTRFRHVHCTQQPFLAVCSTAVGYAYVALCLQSLVTNSAFTVNDAIIVLVQSLMPSSSMSRHQCQHCRCTVQSLTLSSSSSRHQRRQSLTLSSSSRYRTNTDIVAALSSRWRCRRHRPGTNADTVAALLNAEVSVFIVWSIKSLEMSLAEMQSSDDIKLHVHT